MLLHSSSVRGQECIALLHMNKLSLILIYSPFLQYQILMRKLLGKVGKHKEQCTHLSSSRRGFELSTRTTKGPQLSTSSARQSNLQAVFLLIVLRSILRREKDSNFTPHRTRTQNCK
jgi:hypothetical protein